MFETNMGLKFLKMKYMKKFHQILKEFNPAKISQTKPGLVQQRPELVWSNKNFGLKERFDALKLFIRMST